MTLPLSSISIKHRLSLLILGQKGGKNRIKILDLLKERPYNLNQMSDILDLNYRTIKHHVNKLLKNDLISSSKSGGYGEVYLLSPQLESNIVLLEDIIRKFRSSQKLKNFTQSPKFYHNIMKDMGEAVIIVNDDWEIFFWNQSAVKLYGYTKKEIMRKPLTIFTDQNMQKQLTRRVMKGKKIVMFETKGRHKSGKDLDISVTLDAIHDDDGEILGFSILSRDITERREAEQRIRFLNSLLTTVKNINHLTGHESDQETLFQTAAEITLTTRGYHNASVGIIDEKDGLFRIICHSGIHHRNKWFISIVPEIAEPCIRKVMESRSTFIIDNTTDYCSGCDFCAHEDAHKTIIVPMLYRKTIKGLIFFCLVPEHEISGEELELLEEVGRNLAVAHAKIMAEEALHYTEERYALARKAAQIGSWDWNLKTGKLELSEEVECILGFLPGEFTSKYDAFLACVHPDDRDYVETMINDHIKNGGDYAIEHRIVRPDGTLRRIAEWGRVYLDKDKKAKRMIGIVQDITKHMRGDQIQAVKEAREFAESIVATVREPLVVLDKELRVVSANPAFYSTFQMEPEKTEQELLYQLTDQQWNIPGLRRLLMQVIQENKPFDNFTLTYTLPIGKERTILMNARQIFHKTEKPPMVLMAIEDITYRR